MSRHNIKSIGVVGAGTASAVSLMTMIFFINANKELYNPDLKISCIHDPNIPTAQVGEATSPFIYDLVKDVLGLVYTDDIDLFDGTFRYYTKYFWSNAGAKDFHVWYGNPALHVNSEKFSDVVLKTLVKKYNFFSEIHDTVNDITQTPDNATVVGSKDSYTFDYIIDCRGMPSTTELESNLYSSPYFDSVNSVILYPDFTSYDEPYTSAYYHDDGWMFGIPLQHRKAFGYLYNNNITTKEEAIKKFSSIKNIDATNLRSFSWKPFYKNDAMDGRILSMGNRLYFFEPQNAIPLHYYNMLTEAFIKHANWMPVDGLNDKINRWNLTRIERIQDLIALGYCGRNSPDNKFWKYAKEKSVERLQQSKTWQEYLAEIKAEKRYTYYFTHPPHLIKNMVDGFDIDLESLTANK
jgi:hypothetical protein